MNANENGGFESWWYLFITIFGIGGLWNLKKAFSENDEIKMLNLEIKHKDAYIKELEKKIDRYQKINSTNDDTASKI